MLRKSSVNTSAMYLGSKAGPLYICSTRSHSMAQNQFSATTNKLLDFLLSVTPEYGHSERVLLLRVLLGLMHSRLASERGKTRFLSFLYPDKRGPRIAATARKKGKSARRKRRFST